MNRLGVSDLKLYLIKFGFPINPPPSQFRNFSFATAPLRDGRILSLVLLLIVLLPPLIPSRRLRQSFDSAPRLCSSTWPSYFVSLLGYSTWPIESAHPWPINSAPRPGPSNWPPDCMRLLDSAPQLGPLNQLIDLAHQLGPQFGPSTRYIN